MLRKAQNEVLNEATLSLSHCVQKKWSDSKRRVCEGWRDGLNERNKRNEGPSTFRCAPCKKEKKKLCPIQALWCSHQYQLTCSHSHEGGNNVAASEQVPQTHRESMQLWESVMHCGAAAAIKNTTSLHSHTRARPRAEPLGETEWITIIRTCKAAAYLHCDDFTVNKPAWRKVPLFALQTEKMGMTHACFPRFHLLYCFPVLRRGVHVILCYSAAIRVAIILKTRRLSATLGLQYCFDSQVAAITWRRTRVNESAVMWSLVINCHLHRTTTILFGDFKVVNFPLNSGFMCSERVRSFSSIVSFLHRSHVCTPRCRWVYDSQTKHTPDAWHSFHSWGTWTHRHPSLISCMSHRRRRIFILVIIVILNVHVVLMNKAQIETKKTQQKTPLLH